MKEEVHQYVQSCQICQMTKPELIHTPGLLQPLPIPEEAWTSISMDFITGLPKSEGKEVIMVVVDRFTKYSHFIPLSHPGSRCGPVIPRSCVQALWITLKSNYG